jgi:hypothetical protein
VVEDQPGQNTLQSAGVQVREASRDPGAVLGEVGPRHVGRPPHRIDQPRVRAVGFRHAPRLADPWGPQQAIPARFTPAERQPPLLGEEHRPHHRLLRPVRLPPWRSRLSGVKWSPTPAGTRGPWFLQPCRAGREDVWPVAGGGGVVCGRVRRPRPGGLRDAGGPRVAGPGFGVAPQRPGRGEEFVALAVGEVAEAGESSQGVGTGSGEVGEAGGGGGEAVSESSGVGRLRGV